MTKKLYEEALVDAKDLIAAAEDNAKRAVFEAVLPKIRELIESQIMGESAPSEQSEDELLGLSDKEIDTTPRDPIASPLPSQTICRQELPPVAVIDASDVVASDSVCQTPAVVSSDPTSLPVEPNDEDEYVLDVDSVAALSSVASACDESVCVDKDVKRLEASVVALGVSAKKLSESRDVEIRRRALLSRVRDMYERVQESRVDESVKDACGVRLERLHEELKSLKESKMKRRLAEADELDLGSGDESELTIKVKGLGVSPDKLDDATVELIGGVEEDEVEPKVDSSETSSDDDELDLGDLGGEDEESSDSGDSEVDLDDEDEVVEIDESAVRREIARMRKLRESKKVDPMLKDFGNASDEGDPLLDAEVTTEACGGDEDEDLDELEKKRASRVGGPEQSNRQISRTDEAVGCEKEDELSEVRTLQKKIRARMDHLKTECKNSEGARKSKCRKAWFEAAKRLSEVRGQEKKIVDRLEESKRQEVGRSNTVTRRRAESRKDNVVESDLRKRLAEKDLLCVKLAYTNKILQNESMSTKQKASVVERLDEAKTVDEARRAYSRAAMAVEKREDEINESRVIGSSSASTRSSSTLQERSSDEENEVAWWSKLAGLTK